ncbi:MAG: 2-oxoglutarate dehydrogenase complex dihydrolipoyllysine-residue succinyltransferase [Meiothermus sp.]|uniref:2-oxoglutarate dehydrogenase complex dihydrolipoyllysine-residue succinyltransferase n=1 Tax=Meiothermus sp. TaxID=1955249 RepID=UPI0025EB069F|nr:2-oxoglutarate dehydrogenase complex dihydrolipoyllysine-residue succinyltransferase [Meiothermus sp.]MCS7058536.1 2-oxoglutarate dehydrogenase complex dihydrolipoyllysine-residue succinyltransferase [Meiothermus sp.]MCS7195440.1 2-oxoglutarate dehydrogenase complex dihydrolipoyllysine-residue succinyltransferase [Meiothermus sp.]MDW8091067.1 2-oxoglutarate dehydrogenase complex dihydrolipoyllysine-residue succinyltransferase [Meiothermus sp.]
MPVELKIPPVGESITEVEIGQWLKREGDLVRADEPVVELVTDKATLELPAPASGVLSRILIPSGQARVGDVVALLEEQEVQAPAAQASPKPEQASSPVAETKVMPAAARLAAQSGVDAASLKGSGPGGRVLKEDVQRVLSTPASPPPAPTPAPPQGERRDEVVPMTPLRRRIAERLLSAKQSTAMLTTFNEADMGAVMELRREYGESFQKKHGVKLGFMSFFVKAVVQALQEIPQLNAEIRGTDIVYHRYYDIGIAVGGGEGLVVPVLRDADKLSMAQIEERIADFAARVKEKRIKPEELMGGTFTITNGGIYGSLNSTPLLNPPQVGILGMHAIVERPVARNGAVVIRPMMNLALSYDHRIVDGREAVTFLRRVKELIENPVRLVLEV